MGRPRLGAGHRPRAGQQRRADVCVDEPRGAAKNRRTRPPGMASDARVVAGLGDAEQNHIVVAIEADVVHGLHMAGLFALEPQLAP